MDTLITFTFFILAFAILLSPLLVLFGLKKIKKKTNFFGFLLLGALVTFILFVIFGWWSDYSDRLLLSYYGYDFEATNAAESFKDISAANLKQATLIEFNMGGIGWPVKVFMCFVLYVPVLVLTFVIAYFLQKDGVMQKILGQFKKHYGMLGI